jgi:O-antigen/teichoic acid export membrane protein
MTLRKQAASGARWTAVSTIATTLFQFLQLAILARLLSTTDFGLMSMIMVVLGFTQAYADMGISNAIIHHQDATRDQLSSLYWLNILVSVIVFIVILSISPLIIGFFKEPKLAVLLPWAAIVFLITPIGQQFQILLQKELSFRPLAIIEASGALMGSITAIGFAFGGAGVFSLILGQLANSTVKSISLASIGFRRWRPKLRFKKEDIRGYVGFGLFQMGEKSINYFSANVDYLIIGRCLGADVLGVYTLAYQLVVVPLTKINPILTRVAFPIFAKIQNDTDLLQRGFLAISRMLAYISFPLLIGLGVTSPLIIPVCFGEKWMLCVPLIQVLVIVGMVKTLLNPTGAVYLAKGRADIGFYWNLFVALVNTLVFWVAVKYSVHYVAGSYAILCILYFIISRSILRRIIGLSWTSYLRVLYMPFIFSILMGCFVYAFSSIRCIRMSNVVLLFTQILFGGLFYLSLLIIFQKKYLLEMVPLLLNKKD